MAAAERPAIDPADAFVMEAPALADWLIVMPLVGLFETPKALPGSILESVTGPGKQVSGSGVPAGAAAAPSTKG